VLVYQVFEVLYHASAHTPYLKILKNKFFRLDCRLHVFLVLFKYHDMTFPSLIRGAQSNTEPTSGFTYQR